MCRLLALLNACLVLLPLGGALVCYDNSLESNTVQPRMRASNCTECDYCMLLTDPAEPTSDQDTTVFGTGPHVEDTSVLSAIFAQNDDMYEVLTACVLEKYSIGGEVQYLFRCYCAQDGCNKAYNLNDFLARIKLNDQLNKILKSPPFQ